MTQQRTKARERAKKKTSHGKQQRLAFTPRRSWALSSPSVTSQGSSLGRNSSPPTPSSPASRQALISRFFSPDSKTIIIRFLYFFDVYSNPTSAFVPDRISAPTSTTTYTVVIDTVPNPRFAHALVFNFVVFIYSSYRACTTTNLADLHSSEQRQCTRRKR